MVFIISMQISNSCWNGMVSLLLWTFTSMYLFKRMQPGGLYHLWCILFNTALNLILFTGVLGLIKGCCVSIWSRVIYSSLCLLAMIVRWNKNERKSVVNTTKVGMRCYIYFINLILLLSGTVCKEEKYTTIQCRIIFLSSPTNKQWLVHYGNSSCVFYQVRSSVGSGGFVSSSSND